MQAAGELHPDELSFSTENHSLLICVGSPYYHNYYCTYSLFEAVW